MQSINQEPEEDRERRLQRANFHRAAKRDAVATCAAAHLRTLRWARMTSDLATLADRLQALARTGLAYAGNPHDRERYEAIIGIAAAMAEAATGRPAEDFVRVWAGDIGHVTPRVAVGAAIFDEAGRLLLQRRPESGLWALPVGYCEVGESAAEAIAREVMEESRLEVRPIRLIGVYDIRGRWVFHQLYSLVFLCDVVGGELTFTDEAPEAAYFSTSELPKLVGHQRACVADAFAAARDAAWVTRFVQEIATG